MAGNLHTTCTAPTSHLLWPGVELLCGGKSAMDIGDIQSNLSRLSFFQDDTIGPWYLYWGGLRAYGPRPSPLRGRQPQPNLSIKCGIRLGEG